MTFGFKQGRNLDWRYLFGCCQHKGSFNALRLQKVVKRLHVSREEKRRDTMLSPGAFPCHEFRLGRRISKRDLEETAS